MESHLTRLSLSGTAFKPLELIDGITEYYTLLSQSAYFPPSTIQHPPPYGWSDADLDVTALRALNRSEAVIDLLRHIPYLSPGGTIQPLLSEPQGRSKKQESLPKGHTTMWRARMDQEDLDRELERSGEWEWPVWPEMEAIRYLKSAKTESWAGEFEMTGWTAAVPVDDFPEDCVALTTGNRGSTAWIVNTTTGNMHTLGATLTASEDSPFAAISSPRSRKADLPLHVVTSTVPSFIHTLKSSLINLTHIPVALGSSTSITAHYGPEIISWSGPLPRRVRAIYKACGWPDIAHFDRERCMSEIEELRAEERRNAGKVKDTPAGVDGDDKMAMDVKQEDEDDESDWGGDSDDQSFRLDDKEMAPGWDSSDAESGVDMDEDGDEDMDIPEDELVAIKVQKNTVGPFFCLH